MKLICTECAYRGKIPCVVSPIKIMDACDDCGEVKILSTVDDREDQAQPYKGE